jgi:hypothetical protein
MTSAIRVHRPAARSTARFGLLSLAIGALSVAGCASSASSEGGANMSTVAPSPDPRPGDYRSRPASYLP